MVEFLCLYQRVVLTLDDQAVRWIFSRGKLVIFSCHDVIVGLASYSTMSNFDEKSEVAACKTVWGRWYQTMDEVYVEVNLEEGTSGKQVKVNIMPKRLHVLVKGEIVIEGDLTATVKSDDSIWTIEDRRFLRICLCKVLTTADQCWTSLLKEQYEADAFTHDLMQKKLTLQRYQYENPGMDFSNAEISGNYHGGGPELPGS